MDGNEKAPCLRRPRGLTPGEISEETRRWRCGCVYVSRRLTTHFGQTEGFSDDAIRLATLGYTFLELDEEIGNSTARHHLRAEMMLLMTAYRDFRFTHHGAEYRDAYEANVNQMRDCYPPGELNRSVCAGFPALQERLMAEFMRRSGDG